MIDTSETMNLDLVTVDLDVDSDNTAPLAAPQGNDTEEELEDDPDHPGKALAINELDRDKDAVPDFADGYGSHSSSNASYDFVPVKLTFSKAIPLNKATVKFKSKALSDPANVKRSKDEPYTYTVTDGGRVRLWTKNGSEKRKEALVPKGDAILPNKKIAVKDLAPGSDRKVTLYLEALARSSSLGDINIKVKLDPDGPKGAVPYICHDSIKATAFDVKSVHPQADDFEEGEAGKVMISTKHDKKYYTDKVTTKAGKPAQSSDGKVTVSAYITPKPPKSYSASLTTYFEVTDPDDLSHYEGKKAGGTPKKQGDKHPNDNRDPNKQMTWPPKGYKTYQKNCLSSRSAPVTLAKIDGKKRAVAETSLDITDQYSGDNYQVRATLRNPNKDPFDTLSGMTKSADTVKSSIEASETLIAWKRIYIEEDQMYKTGSDLVGDFSADGNSAPDSVVVDDGALFSIGETVVIFDADNPRGENAKITNKIADTLLLDTDLQNNYSAGYGPLDKGAAVAVPSDGTFDADVLGRVRQAYGDATDGTDGGCFVEMSNLADGGGNVPYRETFDSALARVNYRDIWFKNKNKDNYIYVCGAAHHDSVGDGMYGIAQDTFNYIYVYVQEIKKQKGGDASTANPDITSHEIGHQFLGLGQVDSNHAAGVWCHEGASTDYCLMGYERDRTDDNTELCHDPNNSVSHLLNIRDAADGL